MDEELAGSTKLPNIEYSFFPELLKKYKKFRAEFVNETEQILDKSAWRDDTKFLYHLI